MRLTLHDKEAIKNSFNTVFGKGKIYLFGSRIDDTKRGGDIDLFIELSYPYTIKEIIEKKSKFLLNMYDKIGEQKIDIVFSKNKNRSIEKEALREGILL
jgi:predicted nucleotidyltransferase